MSTYNGKLGTVEVGAVAVGEVTDFSYTDSAVVTPDPALGDDWQTNKSGTKSWGGSVNANFDHGDTLGQGALAIGSEVTLNLYPQDSAAGGRKRSGSVIINSIAVTNSGNDGIVSVAFAFTGNGTATDSVVV